MSLLRGGVMMPALSESFWARVNKTETCWLWTGAINKDGYGTIQPGGRAGKKERAHRLIMGAQIGEYVDHKCFVRNCVNPAHLQIVTTGQNNENRSGPNRNNRSSGVRGVTYDPRYRDRKWRIRVTTNRQWVNGGRFATLEEAEAAVKALRNQLMTNNLMDREDAA